MNKFSKLDREAFQKFIEEKNIDSIDITAIFTDDTVLENTAGMLSFPKIGKCKLEIRVKEGGSIPHFHIISLQNKFLCAVCLHVNKYFKHGPYTGELNSSQRVVLDDYLRTQKDGVSVWEYMVSIWNISYNNMNVEIDEQPDYTSMKESLHK